MTFWKPLALGALLLALPVAAPARADEAGDALERFRITELMYQYAWAHNLTDPEAYSALFTEDGEFGGGGPQTVKGREALKAMTEGERQRFNPGAAEGKRSFMIMRTLIMNPVVTLTGDGAATGACYFEIVVDKPGEGPRILAEGRYEDAYRKEDGAWKIARRTTFMDMSNTALAKEIGVIK